MKHLRSGLVLPLALLLAVGCNGEPTEAFRGGPVKLVSTLNQLFIEVGSSKTFEVGAVDDQGNPISSAYEAAAASGLVTVKRDSTFQPVFVNDSTLAAPAEGPRFRFIVTGVQFGATKITVQGAGLSLDIPVQVVPITTFPATFSTTTPTLTETITLTAPAGSKFTDSSEVTLPGAELQPITVAVAPDGTTISFLLPPNVNGPVTVTNVFTSATPGRVFSPATVDAITSQQFDSVAVTFTPSTPSISQSVTATITDDPLVTFTPAVDSLVFPDQLTSRDAVPQSAGAQNIVVAGDGRSLTFDAPPNINGAAKVYSFAFPNGYVLSLPTKATVTSSTVLPTSFAATFSNNTPDLFEPVTLTAPAGFSFASDATITFGSFLAIINSIAPDGSSAEVVPLPGSDGTALVDGVVANAGPEFQFKQATVDKVTVPPLVPLAGTDDPATAPVIALPGLLRDAGSFGATCDFGFGFPCQVYSFQLASASTFTFTLTGIGSPADLGLYFADPADLSTAVDACDNLGRDEVPESCSLTLAAGNYIMGVVTFGSGYPENDPNPAFVNVNIQ